MGMVSSIRVPVQRRTIQEIQGDHGDDGQVAEADPSGRHRARREDEVSGHHCQIRDSELRITRELCQAVISLSEGQPGHPKRQIDTNLAFDRQWLQRNRAMGSADEYVGAEANT